MKNLPVIFLIILGIYWLIDHSAPLPLNHEQFGLFNHNIHRIMGALFLLSAGLVSWKWKKPF